MPRLSLAPVALVAALMCGQAAAEDLHFFSGGVPQDHLKRLKEKTKILESLGNSDAARAFYAGFSVWPPSYAKLRVCFLGGSDATNATVAEIAGQWINADAGLSFDFGKADKPRRCGKAGKRENQIRISYEQPGEWSHFGRNAVVFAGQNDASLNLEGFDKIAPDKLREGKERGSILHQFGHALGLLEEHQNPNGVCEKEFDWNYITSYLTGGGFILPVELGWYEKVTGADVVGADFDAKSIMLTPLPEKFFRKGAASPCFVKQYNSEITDLDRKAVVSMYPASKQARRGAFEKNKAALQKLIPAGEKGRAARALMKTVFGKP